MTVREVALRLSVSQSTVYALVPAGLLSADRIGSRDHSHQRGTASGIPGGGGHASPPEVSGVHAPLTRSLLGHLRKVSTLLGEFRIDRADHPGIGMAHQLGDGRDGHSFLQGGREVIVSEHVAADLRVEPQSIANPLESEPDGISGPGPALRVPEEGPLGMLASQSGGQLDHARREIDGAFLARPLGGLEVQLPATVSDIGGGDGADLPGPGPGLAECKQEVGEGLILHSLLDLLPLVPTQDLFPTPLTRLLHVPDRILPEDALFDTPVEGPFQIGDGPVARRRIPLLGGQPAGDLQRLECCNSQFAAGLPLMAEIDKRLEEVSSKLGCGRLLGLPGPLEE